MKNLTAIFSLSVLAIVIVFDVWTINTNGVESSISQMIIDLAYKYPWMSYMAGFLSGHLFWQMRKHEVQTK